MRSPCAVSSTRSRRPLNLKPPISIVRLASMAKTLKSPRARSTSSHASARRARRRFSISANRPESVVGRWRLWRVTAASAAASSMALSSVPERVSSACLVSSSFHAAASTWWTSEPRSSASSPACGASSASEPSRWRANARNGHAAWSRIRSVPPRVSPGATGGAEGSSTRSSLPVAKIAFRIGMNGGSSRVPSAIAAMRGLGSSSRSDSRDGCESTTSRAAVSQPCVMRRSSSSDASAEASGMPASRCRTTGMKGFGRAASGHASALRPMTQRWSNSQPADSSTPRICTGTSGDSGWKAVSAAMRRSRATALP